VLPFESYPSKEAERLVMSVNVSDFFVQRLYDWGVRRIFGYPGDGINGCLLYTSRCV